MKQQNKLEIWAIERDSGLMYNCIQTDRFGCIKIRGVAQFYKPGDWLVTPDMRFQSKDTQRIVAGASFDIHFRRTENPLH